MRNSSVRDEVDIWDEIKPRESGSDMLLRVTRGFWNVTATLNLIRQWWHFNNELNISPLASCHRSDQSRGAEHSTCKLGGGGGGGGGGYTESGGRGRGPTWYVQSRPQTQYVIGRAWTCLPQIHSEDRCAISFLRVYLKNQVWLFRTLSAFPVLRIIFIHAFINCVNYFSCHLCIHYQDWKLSVMGVKVAYILLWCIVYLQFTRQYTMRTCNTTTGTCEDTKEYKGYSTCKLQVYNNVHSPCRLCKSSQEVMPSIQISLCTPVTMAF